MRETTLMEKAQKIKLLVLDVDGVLTDGRLFFDQNGFEYKFFHAQDGHGIKLLKQTGVEVAVISGRSSESVKQRMNGLGIEHVYQGYENKLIAFEDLLTKLNISPDQAAHVGDDVLDLPLLLRVGLAIAVGDANFAVKQRAHWCTTLNGGQGAVREVCDFIMMAQGTFNQAIAVYLQ